MKSMKPVAVLLLSIFFSGTLLAEDLEIAVRNGLDRIQQAADRWHSNETCFSCHHQTLPMLAVVESARLGHNADAAWLKSQADITRDYFKSFVEEMNQGAHVPGGAATVGYGLWALSLDDRPADEITTAMVNYLLQIQGAVRRQDGPRDFSKLENGRWIASCRRAPMQASMIGDTVLVLIGMEKYATPDQIDRLKTAREAAAKWLASAALNNQQDRLWKLWGLHQLQGDQEQLLKIRAAIIAAQRDDGGWSESDDRSSDPFSTGQTLFMLCRTGTLATDPVAIRARDYLLRTQHADGSWLFESHVKPVQPFFDNGDPHGKHQFISTAATAWATTALMQLLPTPEPSAAPSQ
jgi:N-acyl-D-amino-acid deacylase